MKIKVGEYEVLDSGTIITTSEEDLVSFEFESLIMTFKFLSDVSEEIMLQDPICKELCKYHDMWNGSYSLEGESLSKCLSCIKEEIQLADLSGNELFVYAAVEEWNIDIRFFPDYKEFQKAMLADWEDSVDDYEGMDDSELEGWYEVAEANDWDGIPYLSFGEGIEGDQ